MTNFPKALKRYLPILTWSRDYNRDDNKQQVMTATKKDGKTVYLPGLVA